MSSTLSAASPYGDPLEKREWITPYCIVFQIVSTIFVGLRLTTRFKKGGGVFGLDDIFVLVGWVSRLPIELASSAVAN